jgi:hypothetical protein
VADLDCIQAIHTTTQFKSFDHWPKRIPTLILLPWRAAKRVAVKYRPRILDVIHILEHKFWSNLNGCARIDNHIIDVQSILIHVRCVNHIYSRWIVEKFVIFSEDLFVWTFGPFGKRHFIECHHILVIKRLLALYCWLYVLLGLCELISNWYGQLRIV